MGNGLGLFLLLVLSVKLTDDLTDVAGCVSSVFAWGVSELDFCC